MNVMQEAERLVVHRAQREAKARLENAEMKIGEFLGGAWYQFKFTEEQKSEYMARAVSAVKNRLVAAIAKLGGG